MNKPGALSQLRTQFYALMDYRRSLDMKHDAAEIAATDAKIRALEAQIDAQKSNAKQRQEGGLAK